MILLIQMLKSYLLTAFGLQSHVNFPNYKSNILLDLILSECISHLLVKDFIPGLYLSDHIGVVSHLTVDKSPLEVKECTFCKLKGIDVDEISTG